MPTFGGVNILGIIFHPDFGHPAACLLQDGRLVAWAEEERFVRVKQARGYFPGQAIRYCLTEAGLDLAEVDHLAFGWDARPYRWQYPWFLARNFLYHRLVHRGPQVRDPALRRQAKAGAAWADGLRDILSTLPAQVRQGVRFGLREAGFTHDRLPPLTFVPHHEAHAASAFFASGWESAAILVFDGHGEAFTITIWEGQGTQLRRRRSWRIPHSLGWFYSLFTEYLGWSPNEGEVKLMGLAPYGTPDPALEALVAEVLPLGPDGPRLEPAFGFYQPRSYGRFFSDLLVERLGPPRGPQAPLTDRHRALARAVQDRLEAACLWLAREALRLTGQDRLCLAGGVALNCKMNGRLHQAGIARQLFVQPVSHDAGVAYGAAQVLAVQQGDDPRHVLPHLAWGPAYSQAEVEAVLRRNQIPYRVSDQVAAEGAAMLAQGRIVGWFQGRMEVGPRALGQRSILADPRTAAMADAVNARVKFREAWRPFAMSILAEAADTYLEQAVPAPFMITAFEVPADRLPQLQGVIHRGDGTTRPQTVDRDLQPRFHALIQAFAAQTGIPAVLNTSFNIKGEPVVCTPEDAIRCFFGTGMDVLIIENCIVEKTGLSPAG